MKLVKILLVILVALTYTPGLYFINGFLNGPNVANELAFVALFVGPLLFFFQRRVEENQRAEDKVFKQIKINFQRAFELIENSNLNSRWKASIELIIKSINLSEELENSGIKKAYQLEEQYYKSLFYDLLQKVPTYRYFFGLPREQYENKENSDKKLYELSRGFISKSTRFGERRSEANIYYYIGSVILFSFIRFIRKDDKENGKKVCCEISPTSSKALCQFRDEDIRALKELCKVLVFKSRRFFKNILLIRIILTSISNCKEIEFNTRELFYLKSCLMSNNREDLINRLVLISDLTPLEENYFDCFGSVMSYYDVLVKFRRKLPDEFEYIQLTSEKITED